MKEAYLVDGIRTPIGNFGGSLAPVRPDDLGALVIQELMQRNPGADPMAIADVIMGCANQAGEDNRNVARMSLLLAGLPFAIPGETVNRLCASGLSAAVAAARAIQCGHGELFVAGGLENMTRGPWVISKTSTPFGRDAQMYDSSFGWRFVNPRIKEAFGVDGMGETAENLARREGITREDQDAFAVWSQQKAAKAQEAGLFAEEIVPVSIPQKKGDPKVFAQDEFMKPTTTLEVLAKLKPAFHKVGTVTAGNASGLNDGAAALLFASEEALKTYNLTPKARFVSMGAAGVEPKFMGFGPVPATEMALKRAGLTMNDMDLIEINEAFASQVLACLRGLKVDDQDPRVNPNGGAIALGHPLGMSGARILNAAALELHRQNKRYALVTMCVGVGQGYAAIIERA
jgi:acetyl-CoA acyltransferase